jgi:hypothetical protein
VGLAALDAAQNSAASFLRHGAGVADREDDEQLGGALQAVLAFEGVGDHPAAMVGATDGPDRRASMAVAARRPKKRRPTLRCIAVERLVEALDRMALRLARAARDRSGWRRRTGAPAHAAS